MQIAKKKPKLFQQAQAFISSGKEEWADFDGCSLLHSVSYTITPSKHLAHNTSAIAGSIAC